MGCRGIRSVMLARKVVDGASAPSTPCEVLSKAPACHSGDGHLTSVVSGQRRVGSVTQVARATNSTGVWRAQFRWRAFAMSDSTAHCDEEAATAPEGKSGESA